MKNSRTPKPMKRPRGGLVRMWKRHIWDRISIPAMGVKDPCWISQTPRDEDGYTKTTVPAMGRVYTHRLSFLAYNGNIPEGSLVLHLCHEKSCVNPSHLYLGSVSDESPRALRNKYGKKGRNG